MPIEFQIEVGKGAMSVIPTFMRDLPEFLREDEDGTIHLSLNQKDSAVLVCVDRQLVTVVQHQLCRESDAFFGLAIRLLLSVNESVTVSGGDE